MAGDAMKKSIGLLLAAIILGGTAAWAQTPLGAIKAVKQLPITGVNIVESDKGVFFVSANGRFVFKGPIYDMWNGQPVSTLEEVENIVNRVDLKKVGVEIDQLSAFTLGQGEKEVVIFVSPDCPHCHEVLQQAAKLTDRYTFRLVLFPMGQKALDATRRVWCAGPEKGLAALMQQTYGSLPAGQCDLSPMQRTLVVARVLSLPAVPYLIRHDGKTHRGALKDLAGWLNGGAQEAKP